MKAYREALVAVSLLLSVSGQLVGCSSEDCASDSTCAPASDGASLVGPDAEAADAATPPEPVNPYGVPYPTKNLGWMTRTLKFSGAVLPNLLLEGAPPYPSKLGVVQMADLYDPRGKTHDVVVLVLATRWEPVSRRLLADIGAQPPRMAVVSILGQGDKANASPTIDDLLAWRAEYPWAWHARDPIFAQSSQLLHDGDAPVTVILDARTMEICFTKQGAPADIREILETEAAKIRSRAPSY